MWAWKLRFICASLAYPAMHGREKGGRQAGERFRITDRRNPYWPYALGTSDYSTLTDWPGGAAGAARPPDASAATTFAICRC